jgi:hypothetical protein
LLVQYNYSPLKKHFLSWKRGKYESKVGRTKDWERDTTSARSNLNVCVFKATSMKLQKRIIATSSNIITAVAQHGIFRVLTEFLPASRSLYMNTLFLCRALCSTPFANAPHFYINKLRKKESLLCHSELKLGVLRSVPSDNALSLASGDASTQILVRV